MDSSPTSLFDSYEQDFQQILQSIREKLEGDGSEQRGGAYMPTQRTLSLLKLSPYRAEEGCIAQGRNGARRSRRNGAGHFPSVPHTDFT